MRGFLAAGTGIILLPISVIGVLMLAFGALSALYMTAAFFFLPAGTSFVLWAKCIMVALIGLALLWFKGWLIGRIAG